MGNIQDGYLDATNLKHIELPAADLAKYQLNVGDVLINRTNSLELVGKSGLFDGLGGGDWVFASYLVRLEIDTSKALPGYINAMINSKIGRNYVNRTARRAIGMVNINVKEMKKMRVLLPDLDVQQSVVDRLDSAKPVVDRLIDEQKGDEVSALRESILHQAFSGEL
jgi:type I restriction enzyme S subunit